MIALSTGERIDEYDARFKINGTAANLFRDEWKYPGDATKVEVPNRERYATLELFAEQWHGASRDAKKGRYGYWYNPNAKWDWYSIGGRWTGHFPVKEGVDPRLGRPGVFGGKADRGTSDIVRINEIDFDRVATDHREAADKFWAEYQQLLAGKKFPAFEGPRETAMRIGLARVEQNPHEAEPGEKTFSWSTTHLGVNDDRRNWTDVMLTPTAEEFRAKYFNAFSPLKTYAALNDAGWHAPGEMGWFGCSSDEPDQYVAFADAFADRFIRTVGADDMLAIVDCHI